MEECTCQRKSNVCTYSTFLPVEVGYTIDKRNFFDGSITYKARTVIAVHGSFLPTSSSISNLTAISLVGSATIGNGKSPLISKQ